MCSNTSFKPMPLNTGIPHLAYILLWYPLFTQPFIFREIENLKKIMPLQVYTLYGKNLRNCSEEMTGTNTPVFTMGFKAVFMLTFAVLSLFIKRPFFTCKLFKENCLKKWSSLESFGENLWAFGAGIFLGRKFCEDGIDFVYAPWPRGAATAAKIGAMLANLPLAIAIRGDNLMPADPDLGDKMESAAFIRANNAADKKRIEDFDKGQAKGKTFLVYNSLTLVKANPVLVRRRFCNSRLNILALGRFDVTKGFDVLIDACAILKQKGVNFKLTLAGGGGKIMGLGKLEKSLRQQRKYLELENEIIMPGLINHDELPAILAEHDIFTAPCVIHKSGKRDGIPNTVIEAMTFEMPIIATDVNALPEVVIDGKTGIIIPQGNPKALADAFIWMRENSKKACNMGENAKELAINMFDPVNNAKKLASIFLEQYKNWEKNLAGKTVCAE